MMRGKFRLLIGWSIFALAISTSRTEPPPAATYVLRGILRAVDAQSGQATIAHEAIRGYMPAMTMNFSLANPAELRGMQPGDTLTGQLCVSADRAWLEQVHKVENSLSALPLEPPKASRAVELGLGETLPDVEFVDAKGAARRLHDFYGTALAISFIYLRCPLPTYCPLLNRNFQSAQTLLTRLGCQDRAQFLSVSLDPENDTPERLADFARNWEADSMRWHFVVARDDALRQLGSAVGLEFQRGQNGIINHNLRTVVLDAHGRLRHVFRGNSWTPQELAAELRTAAGQP